MISVFTPSHNPQYLDDAYLSLKEQTYEDWEWVVVLNQGAEWEPPAEDSRVRLFRFEDSKGVGDLKAYAVDRCVSPYIVELDHDDMLMPDALECVVEAFKSNPGVVFVYSDFTEVLSDGSPSSRKFDSNFGWTYVEENGFSVCQGFAPYPHNFGYIWYAPNHLRAFTNDAYYRAGGYSEDLVVLDDQDLMSRLFFLGEPYHISRCLYKQRIHEFQTQTRGDINPGIQTGTVEMYDKYIQPMALAWAKRHGLYAIDLGAAHNKPEGYLGVDVFPGEGVDFVGDFLDLDLPDGSCGVIRAVDFLEHVPDKIAVMNKIWRLLAHGGMLLSLTPSTDGRGAWQDPTHVAGWNENSFWYFVDDLYKKFVPSIETNFHPSMVRTYYPSEWHRVKDIPYVQANLVAVKKFTKDFAGLSQISC